jgi:hypothetical protein
MALAAMPEESPACDQQKGSAEMLTMPSQQDMLGTIDAVRCRTLSNEQKCAIVWRFEEREVWLDEVRVAGRRRALYEWHKSTPSQATIRKLWVLENEAHEVIESRESLGEQFEGHEDCDKITCGDQLCPFLIVIESDPYVALAL